MLQIAKILKSNGTEGGLLVSFRDITPEDIMTEEPVYIEMDGLPVPFFIEDLTPKGQDKAYVHLNDVSSLKDAEELVGRAIYADYFEEDSDGEESLSDLIGWTVKDVGEITDYLDIPANPCIEVLCPDGRSVIIPIHPDFIHRVDRRSRTIRLDIPDGLLDL